MPQRFNSLLTADGAAGEEEAAAMGADGCADIAQIETQLLAVYNDAKAAAVNDALEECAFRFPSAPPPLPFPFSPTDPLLL